MPKYLKNQCRLAAILSLLVANGNLCAQQNNEPPPPKIKMVSINPATNDITIKWTNNITPSFPLDYHIPIMLEFPRVQPTPTGYPFTDLTVPYPDSSVVVPNTATTPGIAGTIGTAVNVAPQGFCLTAKSTVPGSNKSALSDYHFPVYLTTDVDTCSAQAILTWTRYKTTNTTDLLPPNAINKPFNAAIEYEVWGYKGNPPFNQSFAVKLSDRTKDTIFRSETMEKGKNYFFFIKSFLPESLYLPYGSEISTSNSVNAVYNGIAIPSYINIPQIEVNDNSIVLNFQIDPNSELFEYSIERTQDTLQGFNPIYSFSNKTTTSYTDNDVNTGQIYYYRISATRCETYVKRSNIAKTIVLSSQYNTDTYNGELQWTLFKPGSTYSIVRVNPDNASVVANLPDQTYADNIHYLTRLGYDRFCYRVTGIATNGDISISAPNCFDVEIPFYMPDAIDPTSSVTNATTDTKRNRFGPVSDTDPTMYGYELVIFNRWGVKIFETIKKIGEPLGANHLWDGCYKGKIVEPGLYLYTITAHFTNSKKSRKGSVAVFY